MSSRSSVKTPRSQQGLALLVLIIAIVLAFATYSLSGLSINQVKTERVIDTQISLKNAKQALISYALVEADIDTARTGKYGFLPCPDYTSGGSEGVQDGNCGATNASSVGWLPNITLRIPRLRDSTGACLMYAVSGAYKQSPETDMLNEDTNGQFQIVDSTAIPTEGVLPEDRIVAIVFAPGDVLSGQARGVPVGNGCGKDYSNISGYLDNAGVAVANNALTSTAADSVDQFIRATLNSDIAANPYNDKFITITRNEIWSAILKRTDYINKMTNLTEALALCLAEYNNDASIYRLPWPAPLMLTDYRTDVNYDDVSTTYAGRVPYIVDNSNGLTTETVTNLFASTGCNNLPLSIGGVTANLNDANDEYRRLWENWKDHFYYALSSDFEPAAGAAVNCSGNCIKIEGVEVAGVVFFSGSRLPGVTRNSPPIDVDDKKNVSNYIENGNDAILAAAVGNNLDAYTTNTSNDIMFCISGNLPPAMPGAHLAVGTC